MTALEIIKRHQKLLHRLYLHAKLPDEYWDEILSLLQADAEWLAVNCKPPVDPPQTIGPTDRIFHPQQQGI